MRTYKYSKRELEFLSELLVYDAKEDVREGPRNRVKALVNELREEFELNDDEIKSCVSYACTNNQCHLRQG